MKMNFWFYRQEFLLLRFGINNLNSVYSCNLPCANPWLLFASIPPCCMPRCPTAWRHPSLSQHFAVSLSNFLTVINLPATWIRQVGKWERKGWWRRGRGKHRNILFYFFFPPTCAPLHLCSLHTLLLIYIAHNFCSLCGARRICEAKWKPTLCLPLSVCVFVCVGHCSDRCRTQQQDVQLTPCLPASLPPADWLLGCPPCWFLMQSKSKAIAMCVSHSTSRYPAEVECHLLLCWVPSVGISAH